MAPAQSAHSNILSTFLWNLSRALSEPLSAGEPLSREIEQRWMDRLAGVDVFAEDHVRTALIYVRWDD